MLWKLLKPTLGMSQARLNHVMMMYVQKEAAKKLSLAAVANVFAEGLKILALHNKFV